MTSDDVCGHLFGYELPKAYFRIKLKKEACTLMDVPPRKMLQLRRSGSIPYSYIDRKVYYKRQDIIRFMEAEIHRVTPQNRMI